jgi:hypothetical protein
MRARSDIGALRVFKQMACTNDARLPGSFESLWSGKRRPNKKARSKIGLFLERQSWLRRW